MKTNLILTAILFLIMILLPFVAMINGDGAVGEASESTVKQQGTTVSETAQSTAVTEEAETVSVLSPITGERTEMSTEDYLYGTLCAEMPASFHEEALKAQAVACYTYLKWIKENSDNPEKFKADITDRSETHQAFITEAELKEKWGTSYDIYSEKMKGIIKEVLYEYLKYNGETAMTVYHALSPGETVSSESIWSSQLPYLKGTTAPGDKLNAQYISTAVISEGEFISAFKGEKIDSAEELIKAAETDEDGRIKEIKIGDNTYSRQTLRTSFSLKSPFFTVSCEEGEVIFTVYGKGHGVGMSQNSADYMARQGSSYKEILAHFYPGTELTKD